MGRVLILSGHTINAIVHHPDLYIHYHSNGWCPVTSIYWLSLYRLVANRNSLRFIYLGADVQGPIQCKGGNVMLVIASDTVLMTYFWKLVPVNHMHWLCNIHIWKQNIKDSWLVFLLQWGKFGYFEFVHTHIHTYFILLIYKFRMFSFHLSNSMIFQTNTCVINVMDVMVNLFTSLDFEVAVVSGNMLGSPSSIMFFNPISDFKIV